MHKAPSIADLAARATAQSRHIVCSVGSLDGPFLAALQRLQVVPAAGSDMSTWGEGVGTYRLFYLLKLRRCSDMSTWGEGVGTDGEKTTDTACQNKD